MSKHLSVFDADTRRIERALAETYLKAHPRAAITVYRYNPGSIRVRVVDAVFKGMDFIEREVEVLPIIRDLPERLQEQITVLLLLTPAESKRSLFSREFDDPQPSLL